MRSGLLASTRRRGLLLWAGSSLVLHQWPPSVVFLFPVSTVLFFRASSVPASTALSCLTISSLSSPAVSFRSWFRRGPGATCLVVTLTLRPGRSGSRCTAWWCHRGGRGAADGAGAGFFAYPGITLLDTSDICLGANSGHSPVSFGWF